MKVLIVAYACEPGKGSEQGTGWNLARRLAEHHEVTVVTRSNNQEVIEAEMEHFAGLSLSFLYHDLGPRWLKLKKKKFFPVQFYYTLWQYSLAKRLERDERLKGFDLVHHLTFNSFEIPPMFLGATEAIKVWGPIGGGQIAPGELTKTLSRKSRLKERIRGWRVLLSSWNPLVRSTLKSCDLVLFANDETRGLLAGECRREPGMMVDVGVDPGQFKKGSGGGGNVILFAGKFEHRKGTRLLLRAFEKAVAMSPELILKMVGDGPNWETEKNWVRERQLEDSVDFVGRCSHTEMTEAFAGADIFVFPSLRDTTGAIALEAMASEVPTVCLDHQGARLMIDEESGIRVVVGDEEKTISEMADAFVRLSENSELRGSMGSHARERVIEEFSWKSKVNRLLKEYQELEEKS